MRTFKFLTSKPKWYKERVYNPYETYVEYTIRECLNVGVNWRGYQTFIQDDDGDRALLKIVTGLNTDGILRVYYSVKKYIGSNNERTTNYSLNIRLSQEENYREQLT